MTQISSRACINFLSSARISVRTGMGALRGGLYNPPPMNLLLAGDSSYLRFSYNFSLDQFISHLARVLQRSSDQHRTRRLPQNAIDVRSEQGEKSKAGALGADAHQIDLVSFRVVNNLAIRLSFTHDIFDLGPQVRFARHRLL